MMNRAGKIYRILFIFLTLSSGAYAQKNSTLWDNWYTVTQNGTPESYYSEKVEKLTESIKIQVNWWILENQKIRTENLGATAKNSPLLEPLLYNYRTQQNGVEKIIDGTLLKNGKVFSVVIRKNGVSSKPLKAEMLPKLILASFFPVWIHKNYKRINPVQPIEFNSIVEDQIENEVPIVSGSAYEMNPDEYSKETHTRKLRIEFNKTVAYWYVTPQGDALKIVIPSLKKEVLKVSKEKAQTFLKALPTPSSSP